MSVIVSFLIMNQLQIVVNTTQQSMAYGWSLWFLLQHVIQMKTYISQCPKYTFSNVVKKDS